MTRYFFLFLPALIIGVSVGAQDTTPAVEQAVTVSTDEFAADAIEPLTDDQVRLLNQEIDVSRIDLGRLRELAETGPQHERMRLSLEECIGIALQSNPDLQVVAFEPEKSAADILASKGEFDPMASGMFTYMESSQQASAEYRLFGGISSIEMYRANWQFGLAGKLQWGTMYNVQFDLDKSESTYNRFIEEYNGGLTLTITQPLLRGRGTKANLARIKIAKLARDMSDLAVQQAVMETVAQVIKSYWDLVGAYESLRVQEEALANAERLLEISQKRFDIGTAAAIEVLQAKAGVATRQSEFISARSRIMDAEDLLKQMLNMRDEGLFSSKRIVPTDRPSAPEIDIEEFKVIDEKLEESIQLALERRPELQSAEIEIQSAEIERGRASNDLLPKVDVTGGVYQGARDHYLREIFYGVRDRSDNFYTYGVQGSLPIGNRAARGQYTRANLSARQAESRLEKTKQEVMLKVRMAMRALKTSQILIESNQEARKLQETNVAAEEKRLQLGVSTSYRVLQIQQDLTLAQTQEVSSRIAYEKALVDLRLAEGSILDQLGVEFTAPEQKPPVTFVRSVWPKDPH